MLKSIKINYEIIELMQYFWETTCSRGKVADSYFIEIANKEEMTPLYDEDFTKESMRAVLSAIMNRERLNNPSKKDSRFWNNNLWMMEDLDNMKAMLQPLKLLNLDSLYDDFKENCKCENFEVAFVPGHVDTYYIKDNMLIINFFKVMVDYMDPSIIKIDGVDFTEFIVEKSKEALS